MTLLVLYAVGVVLAAGYFGARWGWDNGGPLPFLAGLFWPLVVPLALSTALARHVLVAHEQRLKARRAEQAAVEKILREEDWL